MLPRPSTISNPCCPGEGEQGRTQLAPARLALPPCLLLLRLPETTDTGLSGAKKDWTERPFVRCPRDAELSRLTNTKMQSIRSRWAGRLKIHSRSDFAARTQ